MRRLVLSGIALAALIWSGCATGLTGSPNHVSDDFANLVGKVVSDSGGEVEFWVEYGPTIAYGSQTAPEMITVDQNAPTSVTVVAGGLERATLYHYRFCAQDDSQQCGPGCGEDRTFTTQSFACGETVTADVRLTADMLCFNQPGLVVGADGIEVNLAGHRFSGGASQPNGPRGIDNAGSFDDVTVRNGGLPGWGDAFYATGANRNRVLNVDASGVITAVSFQGGAQNEVRNSDLFGDNFGLHVTSAANFLVTGTEAGAISGPGISVNGYLARIVRNRVIRFGDELAVASGIEHSGAGSRIAENVVDGPWALGGIFVTGPDHVVVDNEVTRGALPEGSSADSAGDGIFVATGSGGTVLRRNNAQLNEGDGIEVRAPGAKLEDNSAVNNGDIGIDAVAGVIDLGGNFAVGNGGAAQCRNVFCQ